MGYTMPSSPTNWVNIVGVNEMRAIATTVLSTWLPSRFCNPGSLRSVYVLSGNSQKLVMALLPTHRRSFIRQVSTRPNNEASSIATAATAENSGLTIFDKVISGEIPSTKVYEDDTVLAFRDINPQAPTHVLLIPKIVDGLTQLSKAEQRHSEILGHLLYAAKVVAEKEGIADGFRVVINSGSTAGQSIYHLHLHVLGGRQMKWPPG